MDNKMKMMNSATLLNLKLALETCGISAVMHEDKEHGFIAVEAELWNCEDGSAVTFGAYISDEDDYEEIGHYADPHKIDLIAEMEKI